MATHAVVSHNAWLEARRKHLAKEKEFTRLRDQLSRERRELPWERVEKDYVFEGANGRRSLSEIFDGRGQLVVYHAMFNPETAGPETTWTPDAACCFCSWWMDNFNGITVHLNHRDITMVAISRAVYPVISAYKERMGWGFPWYSSAGNDFNFDYRVSFTEDELAAGTWTTTTGSIPSLGRKRPASASSSGTRRASSSTPTPPMRVASTCSMSRITTWTWCRRGATRARLDRHGSDAMMSIRPDGD
jgi:predicted dithiol-disulfide oxidoreductase (DUF899 family)